MRILLLLLVFLQICQGIEMSVGDLIEVFELGEKAARAEAKVGGGRKCEDHECSSGWNPRKDVDDLSCKRDGCDDETCCYKGDLPGDCGTTHKVLICENCEYGGDFDYRDDPYVVLNDALRTVAFEIVYKEGPGIYYHEQPGCAEGKECNKKECKDDDYVNRFSMCTSGKDGIKGGAKFPFALNIADDWVMHGRCWDGWWRCNHESASKGVLDLNLGRDGTYDPDKWPCELEFPADKYENRWHVVKKGDTIFPTNPFLADQLKCHGNKKPVTDPHGWVSVDIYAVVENEYEKVPLCEDCEYGAAYDMKDSPYTALSTGLFNAYIVEYVSGPGLQFTQSNPRCCQDCSDPTSWKESVCGKGHCVKNKYHLCGNGQFPFTLMVDGEPVIEQVNPVDGPYECRNGYKYIFDLKKDSPEEEHPIQCTMKDQGQGGKQGSRSNAYWDWTEWFAREESKKAQKFIIYPGDTLYPTNYVNYHELANNWKKALDTERFTGYLKVNIYGIRRACGADILTSAPAVPKTTAAPEATPAPAPEAVCEAQKYLDQGYTCAQLEGAGWNMGPCTCPDVQCASQVYLDMGFTCAQLLEAGHDMSGCGCEDTCQYVCQTHLDQGYTCQECELAGLKCTPCDECGGCDCQKYIDQGYTCSAIEKAGLDCTGCSQCEKCECTELLNHGYTCEVIENHGYDCGNCDCSDKCACTTYLEQGYSCKQVEDAGLDCSHCDCSDCVAQAYFNQGQTCVTLKQAGIDVTNCGCDDICACQEWLDQANLGYTCEMLEEAGMDCSGCNCDDVCTDACQHALDQGFTCEQLKGHNMDCSSCDCTAKCSDNCKAYLPSFSCQALMGYDIDCSGCDECQCSQCGAYLSGYSCDVLESQYGMDCSDCTKC